jgi:3-(3-hydroxy-phenyl)propionate hydroxylase
MSAGSTSALSVDCDVLIIGGGPVGVSAGLFCAAHGLRAEVYERDGDVYPLPRAVAMDDEIQRAFAAIGLRSQLDPVITKMRGAEFVNARYERLVGIDIPMDIEWPNGHHPGVIFHQPELERMLRNALREAQVPLHLNTTVTSVVQTSPEVVTVALSNEHGATTRTARWVIAADGAASPTRKALGIGLTDLGFDQEWVVVDVLMQRDVELPMLAQQICDPARVVTVVPGHGRWRRWEFQMQPGEIGAELARPQAMKAMLSPWLSDGDGTVERSAVYRFHATVAHNMRHGNVFLAGDSAHQMPPFLGQGMCSGIRDVINLSWKMAMIADGHAGDALLDSYDVERRPHAAGVVDYAVDTGRLIDHLAAHATSDDPSAGYGGGRPMPILVGGFLDDDQPFVGREIPNPLDGDGVRLDARLANKMALIVLSGRAEDAHQLCAASALGALDLHIVTVGPEELPWHVNNDTAVLVRPDRIVAACIDFNDVDRCTTRIDHLVETWFRSRQVL